MMNFDSQIILKAISPKIAAKAIQAFDRATTAVVATCWAGAILMMAFALYTLSLSVSAKRAADAALVAEPSLPQIVRTSIEVRSAQVMVDRLQHRYPDLNFALKGTQLTVTASDGSKFRQWLTALSYVDTIAPDFHWSIQNFCVGKCGGNELMRAVLSGEKISFQAPEAK